MAVAKIKVEWNIYPGAAKKKQISQKHNEFIKKALALSKCFLAGEEGFEPPWTVLETGILPLYDSPMCLKLVKLYSYSCLLSREKYGYIITRGKIVPMEVNNEYFTTIKQRSNVFDLRRYCTFCSDCMCHFYGKSI